MKSAPALRLESLCLRHPGVKLVEFVDAQTGGLTQEQAWRHVIMLMSKPSSTFAEDQLLEAQQLWWRVARSIGLLSKKETCLISVGQVGPLPWAKVRLPEEAPVLDIFELHEGNPEFIAMNEEGSHFLAVTSEEGGVWLHVVERHGEMLKTVRPPSLFR